MHEILTIAMLELIRTIIPARGRKLQITSLRSSLKYGSDKNHNPRKGTETVVKCRMFVHTRIVDKNHNPRKGTETDRLSRYL